MRWKKHRLLLLKASHALTLLPRFAMVMWDVSCQDAIVKMRYPSCFPIVLYIKLTRFSLTLGSLNDQSILLTYHRAALQLSHLFIVSRSITEKDHTHKTGTPIED